MKRALHHGRGPAAPIRASFWRLARFVYHRLPVDGRVRSAARSALYRRFPSLFSHLPSFRIWRHAQLGSAAGAPLAGVRDSPGAGAGRQALAEDGGLRPLAEVRSLAEFQAFAASEPAVLAGLAAGQILQAHAGSDHFELPGDCLACGKPTSFLVDDVGGGTLRDGLLRPNWRERLVCRYCRMGNRQRLIAALIRQQVARHRAGRAAVYLMESVTPIHEWVARALGGRIHLVGSEYLGPQYRSGETVRGVRHEDVQQMSFADGSFDLIVSNDVLEHVPEPRRALAECARVLRPGAQLLMTIPFHDGSPASVARACVEAGRVRPLLPEIYHGNPISDRGSLVFTDFGWDVIEMIRSAGFEDGRVELYASAAFGHVGPPQQVFRAVRQGS